LHRNPFIGIATIELQSADLFSKLFYKFYLSRDQPVVIAKKSAWPCVMICFEAICFINRNIFLLKKADGFVPP
jgi:hypothetical protein